MKKSKIIDKNRDYVYMGEGLQVFVIDPAEFLVQISQELYDEANQEKEKSYFGLNIEESIESHKKCFENIKAKLKKIEMLSYTLQNGMNMTMESLQYEIDKCKGGKS